jgi:hypothetical protein
MKKITILRKWNNPNIEISVSNEAIGLSMTLDDFIRALTDEVAEPLVRLIAADAGNPTFLFTKAQLERRLVEAIEGAKSQAIFVAATEQIIEAVKAETVKVM